jgi:phage pi2 protein 07
MKNKDKKEYDNLTEKDSDYWNLLEELFYASDEDEELRSPPI